jgi:Spy/CpxP family protein refolding chaperone
MLKRKLRLTKKQVRQIIIAKKEKFKALMANKGNLRSPMLNALKSGTFNKSVFVSDLTNNVKSKAEIKADFISKFFNILTPVQRNRFINLIKNRIKNRIKHLEFMKKMLNEKIDMMKKMQENLAK